MEREVQIHRYDEWKKQFRSDRQHGTIFSGGKQSSRCRG
jgi:hypothetical protein